MKILLAHSSAGAGHMKAAQAVYNGLKETTAHQGVIIDALDYTSPIFKKLYRGTYAYLISRIPWAWGMAFALLDQPWIQAMVRMIRRAYNALNARALVAFLEKEQFDAVISTHFFPTEVAAALKRSGRIKSKLITVITDFDVHKIWTAKGIDAYTVACPWTRDKLKSLGEDESRIFATGIPTDKAFSVHPDIGQLKAKMGIKEDMFTVLVATGSFGIGPI